MLISDWNSSSYLHRTRLLVYSDFLVFFWQISFYWFQLKAVFSTCCLVICYRGIAWNVKSIPKINPILVVIPCLISAGMGEEVPCRELASNCGGVVLQTSPPPPPILAPPSKARPWQPIRLQPLRWNQAGGRIVLGFKDKFSCTRFQRQI